MSSLYFKYAAMNSGKSTQLLQAHYNYIERGMNPVALTANIDNRHGVGKITARIGVTLDVPTFSRDTNLFDYVDGLHRHKRIDAVLIDESQFMTRDQVYQCAQIVDDLCVPVLCYGLKTDFMGALFEGSQTLLELADNIEEIKALCWCGRKATMTARFDENGTMTRAGDQIAIGGNDMYTSLCRKHYMRGEAKAFSPVEETLKAQKSA